MTEAMRAALRILEATPPERIHTHRWQPDLTNKGGRTTVEQTRRLNRMILERRERGWTQLQISIDLQISKVTVSRHCRGDVKACKP